MRGRAVVMCLTGGLACFAVHAALGQGGIVAGSIRDLYNTHCASCHAEDGSGGLGGSLIDGEWRQGGDDEAVARLIREGYDALGMPAFGDALDDRQIRALVVDLSELKLVADRGSSAEPASLRIGDTVHSALHSFRIEQVADLPNDMPWPIDCLPDGGLLVSGFAGRLFIVRDGKIGQPVTGTQDVWRHGQGGLLDVVAHPDYSRNGWIYLSYSESLDGGKSGGTKNCARTLARRTLD